MANSTSGYASTTGSSTVGYKQCMKSRWMGSLGKLISNCPLPTIDSILANFNSCKSFSTIDLMSSYYHIRLTQEAAEKTAFVTNKGKWIFLSLPLGINIEIRG